MKIVNFLIGIVAMLFIAFVSYTSVDRTDNFFVVGGALADSEYLTKLEASSDRDSTERKQYGVMAHRIATGQGVVLAHRFYTNGNPLTVDDEEYEKATVWLRGWSPTAAAEFQLNELKDVIVVYSKGGSAWPRFDCSGYVSDGVVRVRPRGASIQVEISGVLHPRGNYRGQRCEEKRIQLKFDAREMQVAEMTPWLGRAGSHPYAETYR